MLNPAMPGAPAVTTEMINAGSGAHWDSASGLLWGRSICSLTQEEGSAASSNMLMFEGVQSWGGWCLAASLGGDSGFSSWDCCHLHPPSWACVQFSLPPHFSAHFPPLPNPEIPYHWLVLDENRLAFHVVLSLPSTILTPPTMYTLYSMSVIQAYHRRQSSRSGSKLSFLFWRNKESWINF